MRSSSLLTSLIIQSKLVSDENSAFIHLIIISQAGHRIVNDFFDITLI